MKTKVFTPESSSEIRMELSIEEVPIRNNGEIIESLPSSVWPEEFFEDILISREDFGRNSVSYPEKPLWIGC